MKKIMLFLGLVFGFITSATAQIYQPIFVPTTLSSHMNHLVIEQQMQNQENADDTRESTLNPQLKDTLPDAEVLDFAFSQDRQKKNFAQFVEKARKADEESAQQLEQILRDKDVINYIDNAMRTIGLRANNVADAYSLYWMIAWQAANDDISDFTKTQALAVKQRASSAFLRTPEFTNSTDAIKQEMAEVYLIQSALIQSFIDASQSNPSIKPELASAVRKGAKASGIDLDKWTLTSEGFVPSGKVRRCPRQRSGYEGRGARGQ